MNAAPTLAEGRYTLVRKLGEGGMATVLLAWDAKLKVWRAIKILLPDFCRKTKVRRRFENEAHAMARLEHPHILRVYDVGLAGVAPYLVMEFAQGGCVIDWLETHGAMPPQLAAEVTIQISKGIHAAHEAGIVHRDIKPHNILVTHKGVCKMTDFGIAQVMENDSLTKTGSVMGTWGYMAPEQRTDAKAVDERADIFGLGATLYSMLTNKTPTELYVADEDDDVFDGVEPAMLAVILKACSYKAAQRYPTVKAFARAVRDAAKLSSPTPDATPPLVMPFDKLPASIESVTIADDTIASLHAALNGESAGEEAGDQRVLPYYGSQPDVSRSAPSHGDADSSLPPVLQTGLSPADMANLLKTELSEMAEVDDPDDSLPPYYYDDEPAPMRVPEPVGDTQASYVQFEEDLPVEPVGPAEDTVALPIEDAPAEPEGPSGPLELALRLAVFPLVFGIAFLGVLAWGVVSVNGAREQAVQSSRPLHATLRNDAQGPIIDGLALAGSNKSELEGLLSAYLDGQGNMHAARAYVSAVVEQARLHDDNPVVVGLRPSIDELKQADRLYANAEAEWAAAGSGFPGVLAVKLWLVQAP